MLMQELGRMIKEDPNLYAMTMVDKRKYIISRWNAVIVSPSTKTPWHCFSVIRTAAISRMSREPLRKIAVRNLNSAIKLLCTVCFNAAR